MFNFGGTKLTNLIASFDDFKVKTKKYSQSQTKAFGNLREWACDTNNAAIQDVTTQLDTLFSQIDLDLNKEKLSTSAPMTIFLYFLILFNKKMFSHFFKIHSKSST